MVHLDEGLPCIIGRKVSVGHACVLHGCTVEDEVLVGMGAIILNKASSSCVSASPEPANPKP